MIDDMLASSLLVSCNDLVKDSTMVLKGQALGLDIMNEGFSVDLQDTIWEQDYNIHSLEKVREATLICLYVDLEFFNSIGYELDMPCYILDSYDLSGVFNLDFDEEDDDWELFIDYHITSQNKVDDAQGYIYKWETMNSIGEENFRIYFETDIKGGTHIFNNEDVAMNMYVLRHFREATIECNDLVLYYQDFKRLKELNNTINCTGLCTILYDEFTIESKYHIKSVIEHLDGYVLLGFIGDGINLLHWLTTKKWVRDVVDKKEKIEVAVYDYVSDMYFDYFEVYHLDEFKYLTIRKFKDKLINELYKDDNFRRCFCYSIS